MRSLLLFVILLTTSQTAKAEVCASFEGREKTLASAENLLGSKVEQIIELGSTDSLKHYVGIGSNCGNAGCSFVIFEELRNSYLYSGKTFFHPDAVQIISDPKTPGLQLLSYIRSNASEGSLVRLVQDGCAGFKTAAKFTGNSKALMDFVSSINISILK